MPNHLIHETSPYLLQHAHNPVDWYPWGHKALQRAKDENKPILLSIGYAACHWCHVMAHESFEDEQTAEFMNKWFVNIKVDREERPDLDNIYMQAVVAMNRQGGWPMTVFLTPSGQPFFGGTYYPKQPRYGMPGFQQVLYSVAEAWRKRQGEVLESAENLTNHLQTTLSNNPNAGDLGTGLLENAAFQLMERFDTTWGGMSGAPKFPQPMVLEFLLREHLRSEDKDLLEMVNLSLEKMARGGIYDQLGGGFARYSTDETWLVPHFEKMLYDNAQLSRLYLHAWLVTGNPLYRRVVEETLDFILREMTHPDGGFYSSQDADSEGVEGKYYIWSEDEIDRLLGEEADLLKQVYGVSGQGNWEGHNILILQTTPLQIAKEMGEPVDAVESRLGAARQRLFTTRSKRIPPGLDDKILTAWNGLMMAAFAEAGSVLDRQDYLAAAARNADFLYTNLRSHDGRLLRTWKAGAQAKYNAYLEDYAFLASGLLSLYQGTFEPRWFSWARQLADWMLAHFQDDDGGGFYDTSDDHEALIQRPKHIEDNAIPSGNAMAVQVLLKISLYTGESHYWQTAEQAVNQVSDLMGRYPYGFGEWLNAASFILGKPQEVALIGESPSLAPFLHVLRTSYLPNLITAAGQPTNDPTVPLLAERPLVNGKATAYVCRNFVCQAPLNDPGEFSRVIGS